MSNAGPSSGQPPEDTATPEVSLGASKRKSNRKKTTQDNNAAAPSASSRRMKRHPSRKNEDATTKGTEEINGESGTRAANDDGASGLSDNSEEGGPTRVYGEEDDEDDDPFEGSYLGRHGGPSGLSNTLRALSGMMSGMSSRLRVILENLRAKNDPSVQLIALQELSEILLVSTEDNLAGHFSPDQFVKELVALMQPSEFGEENPEMMLLACRCIANLMEALPASTANVVYGGAVPVLCQKLLEIHYIDLAEQALSTLEKISVEFPASIVREGGLTACLTYLDFFATSTQRTAVVTAANCCRNIPEDSFPVVRDVMPILLNVLGSSDQRVVEQGSLCVCRVIESFKYQDTKLEELVSADLLKAVLRLLLPGSTNMIGANIHTQFLRALSITARASPQLSADLLKMNIVDTLYQILTGVSPPSGSQDIAMKIDKNIVMQALIRTPRDQVFETLNVICELLPSVSLEGLTFLDDLFDAGYPGDELISLSTRSRKSPNDKRLELLEGCKEEVKRFAVILLPTLTHAYTSTVNLSVRQKVLTAQLKMLSNLDIDILEEALRSVAYASYLASILSQQENATLVTFALQAAELLLKRLEPVYRHQFYREGVISEIAKLANRPIAVVEEDKKSHKPAAKSDVPDPYTMGTSSSAGDSDNNEEPDDVEDNGAESEDEDHDDDNDGDHNESDGSSSSSERHCPPPPPLSSVQDIITMRAKKFVQAHETDIGKEMRDKAAGVLEDLRGLAKDIKSCYLGHGNSDGSKLFARLAKYFDGDALESITSYELLTSGIVEVLLDVFTAPDTQASSEARSAFLQVFMGTHLQSDFVGSDGTTNTTPFSVLVHKLQDLLSRSEHFEVITVHQNSFDSNRSSAASMLAKQLRIKLFADEESGIPKPYRNIMVSIHAIATFKALDDYLRPRISLAERPRTARHREGMSGAIAAYAAAMSGRGETESRGTTGGAPDASAPLASSTNRTASRKSTKPKPPTPSTTEQLGVNTEKPASTRRTSRRHQAQASPPDLPPPPTTLQSSDPAEDHLECADETQLSDGSSGSNSALDALVDDLEGEVDEDVPDPSAVNLEVASTGKVTARKEDDGTRVATPQGSQGSATSRLSSAARLSAMQQLLSTPTSSNRPISYAAAIQSVPQDWHIEFSVGDQPIANDTTIYRAVHFNQTQPDDVSLRNVWSATHTIKFKRVQGPPPKESTSLTPPPELTSSTASGLPQSLDKNPTTSGILRLMSILHELNSNLDDVLAENKGGVKVNAEPLSQFVNTKLTAKLNRQLEEPLIVASNCLPSWSEDLARLYPFLFPFETRHLFLQSTSLGYSRSMTRWQNAQSTSDSRHDRYRDERPFLGRLQRQKVRLSRSRILESAIKVMELYGSSASVLEVEYFEEVGTGLGPTLEFYSTVSKEFSKKKTKLWRENESYDNDEYAFGKRGLFPAPMSEDQANDENGQRVLHLYKMLGKFVARSMLDSRIIDISFNPTFFRIGDGSATVTPSLGAVGSVDHDLANSLKLLKQFASAKRAIQEDGTLTAAQKVQAASEIEIAGAHVEDLGLDFTLPGYPHIELQPNGADIHVTIDNVGLYVQQVIEFTLGRGVQKQVDAFRAGFSQVFPYSALKAFTPDELVMLFGRVDEDWSLETLMDSIKADHGYNLDSKSVRNLLQTMSELDAPARRDFLQFVTGSPKLPIGGFKSLTPMFTVVCKPSEAPFTSDDYLPSVMTCVNYLKMPDYSSLEVLRKRLHVAINEGQGAFHLS